MVRAMSVNGKEKKMCIQETCTGTREATGLQDTTGGMNRFMLLALYIHLSFTFINSLHLISLEIKSTKSK